MGTRSTTTVFNDQGRPILSFYRQFDGYFEGHGEELQEFLKEMVVVNGFGSGTPAKAANGMECLAAQLIAHFKTGIGGIYITSPGDSQEYNYFIRPAANGRVSLVGEREHDGTRKTFKLYADDILPVTILRRVTFVYDKRDGERPKWRTVDVTNEDDRYITGFEDGKIKRFLISKIVGGRMLPVQ